MGSNISMSRGSNRISTSAYRERADSRTDSGNLGCIFRIVIVELPVFPLRSGTVEFFG